MANIEDKQPQSGKIIQEDGTVVNLADIITTDSNGNTALRTISSN